MKKLIAFFTAFVLFCCTAIGVHFIVGKKLDVENRLFATWTNDKKFLFAEAITANMTPESMLVFGSSELYHCRDSEFHPVNLFRNTAFHMMMIGSSSYQSLSHAISLAAIDGEQKQKKAVLIVSPQWFNKGGVEGKAFASRFSEDMYISMMKNENISSGTKEYMKKRASELLMVDPAAKKRTELYSKVIGDGKGTIWEKAYVKLYGIFLNEKNRVSFIQGTKAEGITPRIETNDQPLEVDWEEGIETAEQEGEKLVTTNEFYIRDNYYKKKIKPVLKKKKASRQNSSYCESPEYNDLKCFLQVCKELNIQPMIVSVPVNGFWYDYMGFSKSDRERYYQKMRDIAIEYNTEIADFSGEEYTKYFLEDSIHLGWKGWLKADEAIYKFAKQN